MKRGPRGFTIVEVLIAIIVLTVGMLALVGSGALVTRMVGQGKRTTYAAQVMSGRVETLRRLAGTTSPGCTAMSGGTATQPGRVTERWTVSGTGRSRTVVAVATYPTAKGLKSDSVMTIILCN